jgi:C-terminal processing protease CtpA/Prc
MHRFGWILTALLTVAFAAGPAAAGGYGKCSSANTQECLDAMAKMYQHRGWIGVEINDDAGSMQITRVLPDSPAQKAGLVAGDVLYAVNGVQYAESNQDTLSAIRAKMTPGSTFTFTILKGGKDKQDVPITLAPMPEEVMAAMIGKHLLEAHLTAEKVAEAK